MIPRVDGGSGIDPQRDPTAHDGTPPATSFDAAKRQRPAPPPEPPARQPDPVAPPARVPPAADVAGARAQREASDHVPPGGHGLETPYAVAPGDNLTQIAKAHGDSLHDVRQDNAQIKDENVIRPGQVVFNPVHIQGVSQEQSVKLATDHDAASAADRTIDDLAHQGHPPNRAILDELRQESSQSWSHVQSDVHDILAGDGKGKLFPEDHAGAVAGQLDRVYPGDTKFAAATGDALNAQTQEWRSLGVTHDQAGPVVDAFHATRSANPQDMPKARRDLQTAMQSYLKTAYDQAKGSPQQKSAAMLEREAVIESVGPRDASFKAAVVSADTEIQVNQPAARVADAYRDGGAEAAAKQLRTEAGNAGAGYASRIITSAASTIDKVAADLNTGKYASGATTPNEAANPIYDDLSGAVEATDHGNDPGTLGETKATADFVANILARHVPSQDNLSTSYQLYSGAKSAVGDGSGASLSLALAASLKQQGRAGAAASAVEGVTKGLGDLKGKTGDAVTDFAKTDADLEQLRGSWAPFMTKAQLDRATQGYADRNPGFEGKFNQQFDAVQKDGRAVTQALQAYNAYAPDIRNIDAAPAIGYPTRALGKGLADARGDLTGDDKTAFAVMQSGAVNQMVIGQLPSASNPEDSGAANLNTLPVSRAARTFLDKADKHPGIALNLSKATQTSLIAAGAILSAPEAASGLAHFDQLDIGGKAGAIYNTLGFAKYSTELVGKTAQTSIGRFLGEDARGAISRFPSGAPFSAFKSFYYLEGAFASGADAAQAASQGDPLEASLYGLNAAGNAALGVDAGVGLAEATGLVAEGAAPEALAALGPIGAGAALLSQVGLLAYNQIKDGQARDDFMDDGTRFLQDGLGLSEDTAKQLAWVNETSDRQGPAPALVAYARQYGMAPADLAKALDREQRTNPRGVNNFLYLCEILPDKDGTFATQSDHDTQEVLYPPNLKFQDYYAGTYGSPDDESQPMNVASLRQLHYWSDTIFGPGAVG